MLIKLFIPTLVATLAAWAIITLLANIAKTLTGV